MWAAFRALLRPPRSDRYRIVQARAGQEIGPLMDFRVMACGDDLELLMSHKNGCDTGEIHAMAWGTFETATEKAKKQLED